MSCNIDNIDIVSGELQITPAGLLRFAREYGTSKHTLPESMTDWFNKPELYLNGCRLIRVPWWGEWSGTGESILHDFLSRCDGEAALLLCWEGGENYTGLIVRDGDVIEGEVVQTVVPKGEA
jgi:hypothetical protein